MTRRDVIIVSVIINAGLLGILFLTAVKSDPDIAQENPSAYQAEIAQAEPQPVPLEPETPQPVDEVDDMLREYLSEAPLETVSVEQKKTQPEPAEVPLEPESAPVKPEPVKEASGPMVEVTVKRGDALEKIARANHTTVEAIKAANGMKNDKLKIGQVLKIPVGSNPPKAVSKAKQEQAPVADSEAVYYVVKSGDNPWKIAKQFHVKFEDLLKLNQLDEESGKNLKVGDKIRVK